MENIVSAVESMKALTTRFLRWDQKFTSAKKTIPLVGLLVLHFKILTFQCSELINSFDEYKVIPFHTILFFFDRDAAECFFTGEVVPSLPPLSPHTLHILKRDIIGYLFGCFVVDPVRLLLVESRRLPVIVSDIYLTRHIGENVDHVGKRQKLSYISSFEDILNAIFEHMCSKFCLGLLRTNSQVRNLGFLRVCPLVKEKKSRQTTDDPSCVICLNGYEKGEPVMEGPCSHRFHRACLMKWLPRTCPMCRTSCTKKIKM